MNRAALAPPSAVALVLAIVAACAAPAGPSSPGSTAAPTARRASSAPSAVASSPAGSAGASGAVVLPHDDPGLEARLPTSVDGKPLAVFSIGPISAAGNPGAAPIKDLARELGDGTGNFGLAFANDPTTQKFNLFALRVPGAESAELVGRYRDLTIADAPGAVADTATLGGKETVHVTAPSNPIGDVWFYATGDTLFGVQAGSSEEAEALVALLP
jgi:hypothetical protein